MSVFIALPSSLACSAPAPLPSVTPPPARPHWRGFDEVRALPSVGPAWPAQGHGVDPAFVEVRVTPAAADAYRSLSPATRFPAGVTIAAFYRRPSGEAWSVYAMTKRADGWQYVVADPDGTLVNEGELTACVLCHREAPADGVFGMPSALGN
jgi:hypothetical protein